MVAVAQRAWNPVACELVVGRTGSSATASKASQDGDGRRRPKTSGLSPASNDPPIGTDSLRHACRYGGHAISISHQTTAMGLQWPGDYHVHEFGILNQSRTRGARQNTDGD